MITRTIETTLVNYKAFNIASGEVVDLEIVINGKHDEKESSKILTEWFTNGDEVRFIMVNYVVPVEKLYGMPESVFMMYATELPPRKVYEKEEV